MKQSKQKHRAAFRGAGLGLVEGLDETRVDTSFSVGSYLPLVLSIYRISFRGVVFVVQKGSTKDLLGGAYFYTSGLNLPLLRTGESKSIPLW